MPTEAIITVTKEGELALAKMPKNSDEFKIMTFIESRGGQVSVNDLRESLRGDARIGLKNLANKGYIQVG